MYYVLIGYTMLIEAAFYGRVEAAKQLISRGADINHQEQRYGKYYILNYVMYLL